MRRALGDRRPQVAQLAGPLLDEHLALVIHEGDPGRVVAAVFEAAQALHEDRAGLARPRVADDSAHSWLSLVSTLPGRIGDPGRDAPRRVGQCRRCSATADSASASSRTTSASALDHHAQRRLGPGRAHEDPPAGAEPRLGVARSRDAGRDRPPTAPCAAPGPRAAPGAGAGSVSARSARAAPRRGHDAQDLERRHEPVARRGVLADDDVAALLAAEARPGDLHALEDVLVADGRAHDRPRRRPRPPAEDRRSTARTRRASRSPGRRVGTRPRARADRARGCRGPGRRRRRRPVPSTATSRSASPSSANPRSAPVSTTRGASPDGSVAPQREVDVQPVGLVVDDLDPRARGRHDRAADRSTRSRSRSRARSAARSRRSAPASARAMGHVARHPLPARRRPCRAARARRRRARRNARSAARARPRPRRRASARRHRAP